MVQTIARIKKGGNHFEILVDLEKALKFKKGQGTSWDFLEFERIFKDHKKGLVPSKNEIEIAFGTDDVHAIAEEIVKSGEVMLNQEYRDEEKENKIKQVVDFLSRNAIDPQSGRPITPERIKNALEQAHVSIKNASVESQISDIIEQVSKIIPIKIETKKIRVTIPAVYTGKAYGAISQYKDKEEWLSDGSLEVIVKVPAGAVMDFFDKLNSITHGSALTEEMKE